MKRNYSKEPIDSMEETIRDTVNNITEIDKIGNVVFTKKGVMFIKPYVEEDTPNPFYKPIVESSFLIGMEVLIKDRMEHCLANLEKHLSDENVWISKDVIAWENGHFSRPTYKAMQEFVDAGYMNFIDAGSNLAPMAQQVVRHIMYLERNNIEYPLGLQYSIETIFDVCSEMMLVLNTPLFCKRIEEDEEDED